MTSPTSLSQRYSGSSCRLDSTVKTIENVIKLAGAVGIGVPRHHLAPDPLGNQARARGGQGGQVLSDLITVRGYQHFALWFQECVDPLPLIGNQASAGTGSFEDACRRRKAVFGHAVPIDVQRRKTGRIESIVMGRSDMAGFSHVLRDGF